MISFITGKPGGGKGLLSMQHIVDELVKGKRYIICNTPVRIQPWIFGDGSPMIGLKQYLLKTYGKDFDCEKRVFILDDDQTAVFFLWRVLDGNLVSSKYQSKTNSAGDEKVLEFDTTNHSHSGPVLYVIDEAWKFFSARSWQKTGEAALFYASQHRHFGDDVLIVTQHTKQIDPAFQRVAQDFWVVKNHSKLSVGIFRQPDVFSVAIYDQAPTGAQLEPMSRKVFRLDKKGLAQTYDTSAGVGLSGRFAADAGARRKGLPWWGILVFFVLLAAGVYYGLKFFGYGLGRVISGGHKPPVHQTQPVPRAASEPSHNAGLMRTTSTMDDLSSPAPLLPSYTGDTPEDTNDVFCTGYVLLPGHVRAYFSDGSVAFAEDGEIQKIEHHWVYAFGKKYRLVTASSVSPVLLEPSHNAGVVRTSDVDSSASPSTSADISGLELRPLHQGTIEVLPAIHDQLYGVQTPRMNGFLTMTRAGQSVQ